MRRKAGPTDPVASTPSIMSSRKPSVPSEPRIIVRGVHFELSAELRAVAEEKMDRLLRHEERIVRVRLDIEHDKSRDPDQAYGAKGRIEIHGPDLLASVASDDPQKSLDELIDKLDRMLRKRATAARERRRHRHGVEIPSELPKLDSASDLE